MNEGIPKSLQDRHRAIEGIEAEELATESARKKGKGKGAHKGKRTHVRRRAISKHEGAIIAAAVSVETKKTRVTQKPKRAKTNLEKSDTGGLGQAEKSVSVEVRDKPAEPKVLPDELPFDEEQVAIIHAAIAEAKAKDKANLESKIADSNNILDKGTYEDVGEQLRNLGLETKRTKEALDTHPTRTGKDFAKLQRHLRDLRKQQEPLNEKIMFPVHESLNDNPTTNERANNLSVEDDGVDAQTISPIDFEWEEAPELSGVTETVDEERQVEQESFIDEVVAVDEDGKDKDVSVSPKVKSRQKISIVDAKGALEAAARDAADRKMTADRKETQGPRLFRGENRTSKEQLKGIGNVFSNIWKHNLFREYYRQKEIAQARQDLAGNTIERSSHAEAMKSIVQRFAAEYDEVIHEGETRRTLADAEGIQAAEDQEMMESIRGLIVQYAQGELDEISFKQEHKRLLSGVHGVSEDEIANAVEYGDNILEVARNVRCSVEHGKGLDVLDMEFDIVLGRARAGARTEIQHNAVDKIIDKIQQTKVGRFFNETTVAGGVAIAYSLATAISERAARSKLLAWGSFGATAVFGAGIAGGRESLKMEEERRQHAREMAQGRTFNSSESPRRNEMQEYIHEMRSASELAARLEDSIYTVSSEGNRELKDLSVEEVRDALAQIATIEARINISDRYNIDLLAYSSESALEEERLRLDIVRAQSKVDIRERFNNLLISENGKDSDEFLKQATETEISRLWYSDEGVDKKNKLFTKMKRKGVAAAAFKGLATGLVIGGALQEAGAFVKKEQLGFFERLFKGNKAALGATRLTPIEYIRSWFTDSLPAHGGVMHEVGVGPGTLSLPEGYDLVKESNGTFSIEHNGDKVAEYVGFDPDGSFTDLTEQQLTKKGFLINSSVTHVMHDVVVPQTPSEFVAEPGNGTTEIDRALWYDNDTPKPIFDKNELRLWWGGEHNTGIDKTTGEYVFSMARMSEDGSYHNKFSADAQKLMKTGKLKLLLSISQDTQGSVFEIPVDAQGNARIDPNSQIGKLLFREEGGKAQFLGRYAEIAEMLDPRDAGDQAVDKARILATHVGEGIDTIPAIVQTPEEHVKTILDVPTDRRFDPPLVIPLIGRRPLEQTKEGRPPVEPLPPYITGYGYYSGRRTSSEQEKILRAQLSKTLQRDPSAKIDFKKESEEYLGRQEKTHKERIQRLADSIEPMTAECKLSICIPVAGHQESKNIYRTLSNYLNQTANKEDFEIVLFVNNPESDKDGNPLNSDATLAEIERFKRKNPELSVRIMHSSLPLREAKIGNIRKILNDTVLLRSMRRGVNTKDAVLVSNDADNNGVAPEYVSNYIERFDEYDNVDAFLGQLDWAHEAYVKNPLLHVGTRFFQYLSVQSRRRGWHIESSGANFALRSGMYAAVNGYDPESTLGEDVQLGEKLKVARLGSLNHIAVAFAGARASRVYTSARRAEDAIEKGMAPIEQWDKGFGALDELRTKDFKGTEFDFEDAGDRERFTVEVQRILNRSIDRTAEWGSDAYSLSVRRALGWLGIRYTIQGRRDIRITDASKLIEGLVEYQQTALPRLVRRLNPSK